MTEIYKFPRYVFRRAKRILQFNIKKALGYSWVVEPQPVATDWRVFFDHDPYVNPVFTTDDVIGEEFDYAGSNPVAVDATGVYFAGYQTAIIEEIAYIQERLEKRSLDDGSLIWVYLGDLRVIGT